MTAPSRNGRRPEILGLLDVSHTPGPGQNSFIVERVVMHEQGGLGWITLQADSHTSLLAHHAISLFQRQYQSDNHHVLSDYRKETLVNWVVNLADLEAQLGGHVDLAVPAAKAVIAVFKLGKQPLEKSFPEMADLGIEEPAPYITRAEKILSRSGLYQLSPSEHKVVREIRYSLLTPNASSMFDLDEILDSVSLSYPGLEASHSSWRSEQTLTYDLDQQIKLLECKLHDQLNNSESALGSLSEQLNVAMRKRALLSSTCKMRCLAETFRGLCILTSVDHVDRLGQEPFISHDGPRDRVWMSSDSSVTPDGHSKDDNSVKTGSPVTIALTERNASLEQLKYHLARPLIDHAIDLGNQLQHFIRSTVEIPPGHTVTLDVDHCAKGIAHALHNQITTKIQPLEENTKSYGISAELVIELGRIEGSITVRTMGLYSNNLPNTCIRHTAESYDDLFEKLNGEFQIMNSHLQNNCSFFKSNTNPSSCNVSVSRGADGKILTQEIGDEFASRAGISPGANIPSCVQQSYKNSIRLG